MDSTLHQLVGEALRPSWGAKSLPTPNPCSLPKLSFFNLNFHTINDWRKIIGVISRLGSKSWLCHLGKSLSLSRS